MYLITGASGNVGNQVAAQLFQAGEKVRLFARGAGKLAHWGNGVEVAIGDFKKPETFGRAAAGVKGIFLMDGGPAGPTNEDSGSAGFRALLNSVRQVGEPKIVFLSSILANQESLGLGKMQKEKENAIRESGLKGCFLRPGGFMSNVFQWIGAIKAEGAVYNGMGGGKFAPIAPEDIAAVAVQALVKADSAGEEIDLTGGELLSVPEQVNILAGVLGKQIRCVDVSAEAVVQNFLRAGLSAKLAAAVAESFTQIRNGRGARITDSVERWTGRKPKTFAVWARENASKFA
jgi:uncharacterized protein YbjT (DUF2867 family)